LKDISAKRDVRTEINNVENGKIKKETSPPRRGGFRKL